MAMKRTIAAGVSALILISAARVCTRFGDDDVVTVSREPYVVPEVMVDGCDSCQNPGR